MRKQLLLIWAGIGRALATSNSIDPVDVDSSIGQLTTPRSTPVRWLTFCGVLLIAAIAIGTIIMVNNFRERALASRTRELENTVLLLARHFDQQLDDLSLVQRGLIAQMQSAGIATTDAYEHQMSTQDMHLVLKSKTSDVNYVGNLAVLDARGNLINWSLSWPVPHVNLSNREYFQRLKSSSDSDAEFIEPVYSRITGRWTTVLARKLTGPGGEFLGVIARGIEPIQFEDFFSSVVLEEGTAIAIVNRDGTLLARHPHVDSMIGRNFKSGSVFQKILQKGNYGSIRVVSAIDGRDRLISARSLSHFPIAVIATTTVSAALAGWQEQTKLLIGVASLLALVIVSFLFLIIRQILREHKRSEQRLTTAVNNMTQGLLLFNSSGRIVVCNQRYIHMYGLSPDVVKPGCSFRDVIAHRKETGSFSGDVDEHCRAILRDRTGGQITREVIGTADGRSIQVVRQSLANGGWVVTHEDITERRRSEERITYLAHYDALTNLSNRVLFREQLGQALKRVHRGEQLAVLYIDIDGFKRINDSLGHSVGDELLTTVAARLRNSVRETDFVARLGGDEFAIIQTSVEHPSDVADLVARIFETIREPYECVGHRLSVDASIGIALAPEDGTDLDQLLKNADLAMYSAKAGGRRTYRFFEPAMDARVKARRTLELELRQAIAEGGFEVNYQPLVHLRDNKVSGCEALLRWRHPDLGMISPADFIPVAEETGLINELGEWVLKTACTEAVSWPDDVKLAVNVSPVQFRNHTLALKIAGVLAATGLSANRLELEITEAVLIHDDEAALVMLNQLRELGVRIALDDFGTGYSSLSYLQRFPFDKIKIDRHFIKDIAEHARSASIVQAVVNIATANNMTTTAEGVETEQQREFLRTVGCIEMQGYLFSPPRPAEEIVRLLSRYKRSMAVA